MNPDVLALTIIFICFAFYFYAFQNLEDFVPLRKEGLIASRAGRYEDKKSTSKSNIMIHNMCSENVVRYRD